MREILEENAKQGNEEYRNYMKHYKRKEKTLTVFVVVFIILVTCGLLVLNSKLTNKAQKSCEVNHSYEYCINHV